MTRRRDWRVSSLIISTNSGLSVTAGALAKAPGNRRHRGHGWRHQMGAALKSLTALEIAVRGRSAALFRRQLVGVHRQTHRAARLAPLEAGLDEDLVEALGFRLFLHDARARHDHRIDMAVD